MLLPFAAKGAPHPTQPSHQKHTVTRARRLCIVSLVILLSVVAGLLGTIGTERGRITLIKQFIPHLARSTGWILTLQGLTSPSLTTINAQTLLIAQVDPEHKDGLPQDLIHATNVSMDIAKANIHRRSITIKALKADTFKLVELPKARKPSAPKNRHPNWQLNTEKIYLKHAQILPKTLKRLPALVIAGDITLFQGSTPLNANFSIQNNSQPNQKIEGHLSLSSKGLLSIAGQYEEAQSGPLNQLLKRQKNAPVHAQYVTTINVDTFKASDTGQPARPVVNIQKLQTNIFDKSAFAQGQLIFEPRENRVLLSNIQIDIDKQKQWLTGSLAPDASNLTIKLNALPLHAIRAWLPQRTLTHKAIKDHIKAKIHGEIQWQRDQTTAHENRIIADINIDGEHQLANLALSLPVKEKDKKKETEKEKQQKTHEAQQHTLTAWLSALPHQFTSSAKLKIQNQQMHLDQLTLDADCFQASGSGQISLHSTQTLQASLPKTMVKLSIPTLTSECLNKHFVHHLTNVPISFKAPTSPTPPGQAQAVPETKLDTMPEHTNQDTEATLVEKRNPTEIEAKTSLKPVFNGTLSSTLLVSHENDRLQGKLESTLTGTLDQQAVTLSFASSVHLPQKNKLTTAHENSDANVPHVYLEGKAKIDKTPIEFSLDLSGETEKFSVHHLKINLSNNGPITIAGNYNLGQLDFFAQLHAIDLPTYTLKKLQQTKTSVSGLIGLRGTLAAPILQANLEATLDMQNTTRPTGSVTPHLIPNQHAKIFMDTLAEHFVGNIALSTNDQEKYNQSVNTPSNQTPNATWATLDLSIPRFAFTHPIKLPKQQPAAATLWVRLNEASTWFTSTEEALLGELVADIQIPRISRPEQFTGFIRLNHGSYENHVLKLLAEDIHLYAEKTNISGAIQFLGQGTDGNKGRYRLRGALPWPPEPHAENSVALTLEEFQVGYRNALSGKTTGKLALKGDFSGLTLSGDITLQPTLISLENLNTSTTASLDPEKIRDKNSTQHNHIDNTQASPPMNVLPPIGLNLNIKAPQQAYLRGRGLEAELAGDLRLTGTLKKPALKGKFTGIRGDYKIFGRKFILQDTQVQMDENNVIYQIAAEHKRADLQIQALISGNQEELTLKFTSTPELPEDEIIAFLLFGKTIDRITPTQAIQLASALQQLRPNSSGENSFDPLGKTRDLIRVDTLTIDSSSEDIENSTGESPNEDNAGGLTIGVGKYINDRVYVEFLKDSGDSKSWRTNVEIEITPSLDLKTNAERNRGFSGLELQWHRDY